MAITFSQPTDSGSIDVAGSSDDGSTYTLIQPRLFDIPVSISAAFGGGQAWWWVYGQMDGCNGLTRTIRIPRAGAWASGTLVDLFYKEGAGAWTKFPTGSIVGNNMEWSKGSAWGSDTVQIATSVPYSYGDLQTDITAWKASPFVWPTVSGDSDLIVGTSPGTTGGGYQDKFGNNVPQLNLYAFRIGASASPKPYCMVLSGRCHCGETNASHTLAHIVDWLIGSSAEAADLRGRMDVYVFPMLDMEGVYMGYFRGNPEDETQDFNRIWDQSPLPVQLAEQWSGLFVSELAGVKPLYWFEHHHQINGTDADIRDSTPLQERGGIARMFTFTLDTELSAFTLDQTFETGQPERLRSAAADRYNALVALTCESAAFWTVANCQTFATAIETAMSETAKFIHPAWVTDFAQYVEGLEPTFWTRLGHRQYPFKGDRAGAPVTYTTVASTLVHADYGRFVAFSADGTNYVSQPVANKTDYSATGCTFVAWFRMDPTGDSNSHYLIGHGGLITDANSVNFGVNGSLLGAYPSVLFGWRDDDGNGPSQANVTWFTNYDDGAIHMVAFGATTNNVKVWWDGELVYEYTGTFDPAKFDPWLDAKTFYIGMRGDASTTRRWIGDISDVMRFDRQLTTEEVQELLNYSSAPPSQASSSSSAGGTGPLGWLPY